MTEVPPARPPEAASPSPLASIGCAATAAAWLLGWSIFFWAVLHIEDEWGNVVRSFGAGVGTFVLNVLGAVLAIAYLAGGRKSAAPRPKALAILTIVGAVLGIVGSGVLLLGAAVCVTPGVR